MASREIISTPFPSVEEVASELGVSPARVRKLRKLASTIASEPDWKKYVYKVGDTIKYIGITRDLEQREAEHRRRWPGGHIEQIGRATTEELARKWEEKMARAPSASRALDAAHDSRTVLVEAVGIGRANLSRLIKRRARLSRRK